MNILITGGAGFIGSHLTERLLENEAGSCGFAQCRKKHAV